MTYSGDDIIFGVKRTVDDTCKDMLKYIEKNHDEIYEIIDFKLLHEDHPNYDNDSDYDRYDKIDDELLESDGNYQDKANYLINIMDQLDLSIEIIKERCCFFESDKNTYIFIGTVLASNDTISKRDINEFDSFEKYYDFYTVGIKYAKQKLKKNKTIYKKDINTFIDGQDIPIKFYSIPNDCYACT